MHGYSEATGEPRQGGQVAVRQEPEAHRHPAAEHQVVTRDMPPPLIGLGGAPPPGF